MTGGGARTVAVHLADMSITPARMTVPAGTRLVLQVTNTDDMRHDIYIDGGPQTPLLAHGQSARLDLGTPTHTLQGWCTVPGHKAAGMTMTITGAAPSPSPSPSPSQSGSMTNMPGMSPDGYVDQYDHSPIQVRAGERIRVWIVDVGPQLATSFHVVGTQFDTVLKEGAYLLRPGNAEHGAAQTLDLAPAQGGFVEFTLPAPGHYAFIDHAMVDAEHGAHGILVAISR